MPRICLPLAIVGAILVALPCAAAPLDTYGGLPNVEQAAISPDGALIAVILTDGETRKILIVHSADNSPVMTLEAGAAKVRSLQWAGSGHLLITSSVTGIPYQVMSAEGEWDVILDVKLKDGSLHTLLHDTSLTLTAAAGPPMIRILNGKPYAFVQAYHYVEDVPLLSLFKVSLDDNTSALEAVGSPQTNDWLVDSAGTPLAQSEYDVQASHWQLRVLHGANWQIVKAFKTKLDTDSLLGLGRDGRSILLTDTDGDETALRELPPDADDWGPRFSEQDEQGLIFDPVSEKLIGIDALVGDTDRYTFFSAADQQNWEKAVRAYPGQRVSLVSLSADHRKLVVLVDSPVEGPAYGVVDLGAGQAHWISPAYVDLKPDDVSPVQSVAFQAKDGTPLTGYLTLPRGRDPKNLPLVVFPHGGPAARDAPGFDWWAQAMAAQGYAVLQVNYRGSHGFGWKFESAGFGEWGQKMQTDLSDGVRYLAAQGAIDPARVCIVGASYGGYAALAGATLDPGVYRCAVDVSGPAELTRFVAWAKDQNDVTSQRYWDRFMGASGPKDPHLAAISPADHADKATIPILIIHGRDDTVVPFEQSQTMVDALKHAGKPVELVVLKHEDHWLSHGDTRLQMLQAVVDFLKKNNPAT